MQYTKYRRFRSKYITERDLEKQRSFNLNDDTAIKRLIPDEAFILAIGTSHTAGCCKLRDLGTEYIVKESRWGSELEKLVNIPVLTIGSPGCNNTDILHGIMDIIELSEGKCVGVIAEVRQADMAGSSPRSLYNYDIGELFDDNNEKNGEYTARSIVNFFNVPDHLLIDMYIKYAYGKSDDKNYMNDLLTDQYMQPNYTKVRQLSDSIKYHEFQIISGIKFAEEQQVIRTIQSFLKGYNVPFLWFYWDNLYGADGDEPVITYILDYLNKNYKINNTQSKTISTTVNAKINEELGNEYRADRECNCGHLDASVHNTVALWIAEDFKSGHFTPKEI